MIHRASTLIMKTAIQQIRMTEQVLKLMHGRRRKKGSVSSYDHISPIHTLRLISVVFSSYYKQSPMLSIVRYMPRSPRHPHSSVFAVSSAGHVALVPSHCPFHSLMGVIHMYVVMVILQFVSFDVSLSCVTQNFRLPLNWLSYRCKLAFSSSILVSRLHVLVD